MEPEEYFTHKEARGKLYKLVRATRGIDNIPAGTVGTVHRCVYVDNKKEKFVVEIVWQIPNQDPIPFTKTAYQQSIEEINMSQR